ncbi:MAG: hypothetical protein AB7N80_05615 [Bdellovibrionales bacterium]
MSLLWKKLLSVGIVVLAAGTLSGCEEEESNDLAKAQACLDKISSTNYSDAEACLSHVAKYDSQQANILKCSIKMVAGGLTTDKVSEAYKKLSAATGTNEAAFISVLAMADNKAEEALPYCVKTGLKGLIYLANLAVMGTALANTLPAGGYDPNDPSTLPTQQEIDDMINNCQPGSTPTPGGTACGNTEYTAIGNAAVTLGASYCAGSNATSEVCTKMNTAITNGGSDAALIAKELMCLLDNKTYDSIGDACI